MNPSAVFYDQVPQYGGGSTYQVVSCFSHELWHNLDCAYYKTSLEDKYNLQ